MDQNEHNHSESLDLDDLLPQVGEFGRYQKLLLWLICLPACLPCGFCAFNQLFMTETPDHWCKTPQTLNLTQEERKNIFIPKNNNSFSKCLRYTINWTQIMDNITSGATEECSDGWEFDQAASSSIVTDFELVCDKSIYPTLGLVALNLGGPVGVYYFGMLNDSIGRKKSFFVCLTTLLLGSVLTATAQNFWWWAASRVIVGLTIPAIYQIPFIISLELVGPNYRSFVTVMICLFYTLGLLILSGVAYLIRDWVYFALSTSLPFILYYFYWFFLPESPRWLLAKGRFEEASRILETLARVNNHELPPSFKQQLKQKMLGTRSLSEEESYKKTPHCTELCATPNMRLKTVLITLNWFANEVVYVGLSYYGPSLGSNEYMSFFLSSAIEIPSYFICWLVMDRWGRRWPLCLCMIISGICCITTFLLPEDSIGLILALFLMAKSAIAASFLIIYPFAGELFPTQLRGLGIGVSAYIGGMGRIIIPFITFLGSEMVVLPLLIMGIISVIGGLIGLRLPETLHYRLPQTLEEGEEFGKDFTIRDCLRCIPIKPETSTSASEDLELEPIDSEAKEDTPLSRSVRRKISIHRLAKQASVMDAPKDADGSMKITNWF
ncbi:Organic cation transporter protein-like Protein [Tribolium castaneum]|uniref:Organic cation transporter protein-like Protein n=1 Tax=Tribolium castaneum TaxID=7070 RepID=D6WNI6_TRICA|nr:PREDICTED: organic cation transporter protein [Tribolium castaneum]EFA04375.1 Organic cation transporter protein-like Protein [Tribolium castaneum]|eukprot:XP_973296.1 PREDICTED: organic cation transporter protein [Tribolium castaneum]